MQYIYPSLEIRAAWQRQCSTLEALFYCCLAAEIAERSQNRLALLLLCSSGTRAAAGGGRTLGLLTAEQQLEQMLKVWKYQMSSLKATEFAAVGLLPAKLAQFKVKPNFCTGERVGCTKPTQEQSPTARAASWALGRFVHFLC